MSSSIIDFVNCHTEKNLGKNKYINDKFFDVKELNGEKIYQNNVLVATQTDINVLQQEIDNIPSITNAWINGAGQTSTNHQIIYTDNSVNGAISSDKLYFDTVDNLIILDGLPVPTRNEVNYIQDEINTITGEINDLNNSVLGLTHRVDTLETTTASQQTAIDGLGVSVNSNTSSINDLGVLVNSQGSTINDLGVSVNSQQSQINTLNQNVLDLQEEDRLLQTQINNLASDIDTNTSNIATNTSNIATNTSSINDLGVVVNNQGTTINSIGALTNTNTSNIATNTSNISTLQGQVSTNTSNIATNTSNIATNTSNIATNTSNIATNTSNIATNTSNIATNTSNISTLQGQVSTNTSNIATNTSNIATNTSDISTINSKLKQNLYNYYVSSVSGNDTTGTGDVNNPYQTISKVMTVINSLSIDTNVIINLSAGNYTENVSITKQGGGVSIVGGSYNMPNSVVINGNITFDVSTSNSLNLVACGMSGIQVNGVVEVKNSTNNSNTTNLSNMIFVAPFSKNCLLVSNSGSGVKGDTNIQNSQFYISDTIGLFSSGGSINLISCNLSNNPLVASAVQFIKIQGFGRINLFGNTLIQDNTSASCPAIIEINNDSTVSSSSSIISNIIKFTSSTVGASKFCILFSNSSSSNTYNIFNNTLITYTNITNGTPLNYVCVQKTGAGALAIIYGGNLGRLTNSFFQIASGSYTKTALIASV